MNYSEKPLQLFGRPLRVARRGFCSLHFGFSEAHSVERGRRIYSFFHIHLIKSLALSQSVSQAIMCSPVDRRLSLSSSTRPCARCLIAKKIPPPIKRRNFMIFNAWLICVYAWLQIQERRRQLARRRVEFFLYHGRHQLQKIWFEDDLLAGAHMPGLLSGIPEECYKKS